MQDEPPEFIQTSKVQLPARSLHEIDIPEFDFTDVTNSSGLDFVHVNGAYGERLLPETMGSGIAFFDYDLDGDQDLLLVNSTYWSWHLYEKKEDSRTRLFQNDGAGNFFDVTEDSLDVTLYGMGVAVGDFDGDRYPDLFITALGVNRLLRNKQGTAFVDVTDQFLVGGDPSSWSTCATFFDYDQDGDLDLFVCNYVSWSQEIDQSVNFQLTGIGRAYGPPTDFAGTQNWLYRNDGDAFTDVSDAAGIFVSNAATGDPIGKALAVLPLDLDDDFDTDLVIANDTVRNFVYVNQGDGTFSEEGIARGIAFDNGGAATGAMGIDATTVGQERHLAIAIGNFANEMTSYYVRRGSAELFSDDAIVSGIGAATRSRLTFGVFFADFDRDGRDEFFSLNGHVEPAITQVQASQSYEQSPQLFWACGPTCARYFAEVSLASPLAAPIAGRSAAYADIDSDGDLDFAISEVGGKVRLYRNDTTTANNWLRVLPLDVEYKRPVFNARVEVHTNSSIIEKELTPTRGYLSQMELPLTFGVGTLESVPVVKITWPDGKFDEYRNLRTNTSHELQRTPVLSQGSSDKSTEN